MIQVLLDASKADDVRISVDGGRASNLRFARNTVSTSGTSRSVSARITSTFGNRSGSTSFNQFDDASLVKAVRRAEELARLAPEDPEYLPPPGPQRYPAVGATSEATERITPDDRARIASGCIALSREKGVVSAGFIDDASSLSILANDKGLRASHASTSLEYSVTSRTPDGTGSGWASGGHNDASKMDGAAVSARAVGKAAASVSPQALEPGRYTVVLEAQAVSDLLRSFVFRMDARSADEGRSYFSGSGGGTRIGEQLFPESVTLVSDPTEPGAPGFPWSEDGLPSRRTVWLEGGVVKTLRYSRYWAREKNAEPVPSPSNIILSGGTASLDDLISSTERGVLVTRFWYIRDVDPRTMLLTGLTRDGTFLIEKGRIVHPVKNFRFNESPVAMLKNAEMMGSPERLQNGGTANLIPPLKVREFTFSSLSDAV